MFSMGSIPDGHVRSIQMNYKTFPPGMLSYGGAGKKERKDQTEKDMKNERKPIAS